MEVKIDTTRPPQKTQNKWTPLGDWRWMLAMALLMPISQLLATGQNPLAMNPASLLGIFLGTFLVVGILYMFNKPK